MEEIKKDEAFDIPPEELEEKVEEAQPAPPPPKAAEAPKLKVTLGEALTLVVDQVVTSRLPPGFAPPPSPQDDLFRQLTAAIVDEAHLIDGLSIPEDTPWTKRALIVLGALGVYTALQWYRIRQWQKFYEKILAAQQAQKVQSPPGGQGGNQGTPGGGGAAQPGPTPPSG
jgi:hypothetical protein